MKKRLAITVILLIALMGLFGCTGSQESNVYHIMVENDTVINGKEQLQSFFDDYMSGRPCTLDIFEVAEVKDGKYVGTSNVLNITENQDCFYYQIAANDDKYTAYENAEYSDIKTYMTKSNPESMPKLYFALFDGIDCICFASHDVPYKAEFNMDFLENKYENSDKLYDVTKAETVTIKDGKIESGEDAFYDFVRTYFEGRYGFVHIVGDNDIIIGKYDYHDTLSIVGGETSTDLNFTLLPVWKEQTVGMSVYGNGEFKHTLLEITFDKAFEEKIFFCGNYTSLGAPNYFFKDLEASARFEKTDELVKLLEKDINASNLTEQEPDAKSYSTYISGCQTHVYFYRNEDGTISDTVGVLFPESYLDESKTVHYYKISEKLQNLLSEGYEN